MYIYLLIILTFIFKIWANPLNGKHLRILGSLRLIRNGTGEFVDMSDGSGSLPFLMEWLSRRLNFTYSYTKSQCTPEDRTIGLKMGLAGVECGPALDADIYLGSLVPLYDRFRGMDFSSSIGGDIYGVLIPIPKSETNLAAVVAPFHVMVWIFMILTTAITAFCTHLLSKFMLKKMYPCSHHFTPMRTIDYLAKTFFSQGEFCRNKQTPVRLILSAWALFTFVMVQSYSTTLISFVTSPNLKPIIKSIRDIPNVPKYTVTVDKGLAADLMFSSAPTGLFKYFGDMLRADPSNRCEVPQDCFNKVKSGEHLFIEVTKIMRNLVYEDRKNTGVCSAMVAKEYFNPISLIIGIRKNSPYTATINNGISELSATGLYNFWRVKSLPFSNECQNKLKEKAAYPRLTVENLLGAFIVLAVGILLSFLAFLCENIVLMLERLRFKQP